MEKTEDLQEAVEEEVKDALDQTEEDLEGSTKVAVPEGMSKNQMKKMLKRQKWLDQKMERR